MISKTFLVSFLVLITLNVNAAQEPPAIINSAAIWANQDKDTKIGIIAETIKIFKEQGIIILKEPEFYVDEIDATRNYSPEMFVKKVGVIFKVTAIMYRDFDNGEDPDELIRSVLGEEKYSEYVNENHQAVYEQSYLDWKERQ